MNGESLGDKREVLRREKGGWIWRKEEKDERKKKRFLREN